LPCIGCGFSDDSAEEAKKHLAEALHLFLVSCFERGNLEAVLKECGFSPVAERPSTEITPIQDKIDIPLYLLAKLSESGQYHHA
jgi:hypothetical protein